MVKRDGSMNLTTHRKMETSKKALWLTASLFTLTIVIGVIFTYLDKDTTLFTIAIPATGAVFGATVTFYLNKAKMENVFKGKISFLEYRLKLLSSQPEELHDVIDEELTVIDDTLSQSINNTMEEAVTEQITVSDNI